MSLTTSQKLLIEAITESDLHTAKKLALTCVQEDATKKNEWWCKDMERRLGNTPTFLELPLNLTGILTLEDVSGTFLEDRYFISEREQELYDHILRMTKAGEELSKRRIGYLNSALLYGPSGTGKTTFGRYVAYKMGLPFLYINFSSLVDSYMGKTAKNLELIFNFVRQNKCVFMIDEIDTISTRRSNGGGGPEAEVARVTVTLMQELDKLSNEHIVIAATNRLDMMDEALLRRFSKKHEVQILTIPEKLAMTTQYLDSVDVTYSSLNIKAYCNQSADKPQSQIINEVIEAIIQSLTTGDSFNLNTDCP